MLIADVLADAAIDLSARDGSATTAIADAVEVLKAAVPFLLPVRIVTGHVPASNIVLEDANEPYCAILLRWFAVFVNKPTLEGADLVELICRVRDVCSDRISREFQRKRPPVHDLLRKRALDECYLCDEVMIRWLSCMDTKQLYRLAIQWDVRQLQQDDQPGVLEELGLTVDSMLDLPEEELIGLDLIARLERENQQHLSDFWEFLGNDPVGVEVHRLLNDALAATFDN